MAPPNMQQRGLCPLCRRNVALLQDNTVARPHNNLHGVPCLGHGMEGEPIPAPPPGRIQVRRSLTSNRWRVTVGDRLVLLVDDHVVALAKASELADAQRERVLLLTAEQFPRSSDLERERWAA